MSFVPAHIQPFIEAIGEEATEKLLMQLGGAPVYVAANPKTGLIVDVIGVDNVSKLAKRFGTGMVPIPNAKSWLIERLSNRGLNGYEIAREMKTSDRTVRKSLNKGKNDAQIDLFKQG